MQQFVEEKKASLAEQAESDEISEMVVGLNRRSGTRIALALLELGDISESQRWFQAAGREWISFVPRSHDKKLERYEEPNVGKFEWLPLIRGLQTAILSGDSALIDEATNTAIKEATSPTVDQLPGAEANPRISAIAALASVLNGENPSNHLERLSSRVESADRPHDKTLYPPMDTIIDGLHRRDDDAVEQGIKALEDYHEEFIVGSDVSHFTEKAVNIDACTFIVLARRFGLDVRVQSKYIPEAVYDEEYYPLEA